MANRAIMASLKDADERSLSILHNDRARSTATDWNDNYDSRLTSSK